MGIKASGCDKNRTALVTFPVAWPPRSSRLRSLADWPHAQCVGHRLIAPPPSSPAITNNMRANKRVDTKPEIQVRSLLHRDGYRFRKDLVIKTADIRVRPDIVFTRQRVAVFIDGCFWHLCPDHGHVPRTNSHYWQPKLERNVARDERVNVSLRAAGWSVLRLWEHISPSEAALTIGNFVGSLRAS